MNRARNRRSRSGAAVSAAGSAAASQLECGLETTLAVVPRRGNGQIGASKSKLEESMSVIMSTIPILSYIVLQN